MEYSVNKEKVVFDNHFKIIKAEVSFETYEGKQNTAERFAFERGDSAAIILVEKDTQSILLTEQFRYPSSKHDDAWLTEITAGSIKENEDPKDCIVREVMEELGYRIDDPILINTFYTSPGGSTERVFLYSAEVSEKDKTEKGGGQKNEKEDIKMVKIPISEVPAKISELKDAKTIIALQHFFLMNIPKNRIGNMFGFS